MNLCQVGERWLCIYSYLLRYIRPNSFYFPREFYINNIPVESKPHLTGEAARFRSGKSHIQRGFDDPDKFREIRYTNIPGIRGARTWSQVSEPPGKADHHFQK